METLKTEGVARRTKRKKEKIKQGENEIAMKRTARERTGRKET